MNTQDFRTLLSIALKGHVNNAANLLMGVSLADVPSEVLPALCLFLQISNFLQNQNIARARADVLKLTGVQEECLIILRHYVAEEKK